jgi:hypothetical protein
MIRRRENGKQADAPCFQESSPCFLSVICFWRNYLKSLIPLSDLPVRAQSPPCFSWKISLFSGEKQGSAAAAIGGVAHLRSTAAAAADRTIAPKRISQNDFAKWNPLQQPAAAP